MGKTVMNFKGTTISNLVEHLYSTGWVTETINNICKRFNKDQKQDLEQYIYLYILEHPNYFIKENKLKPIEEITYYLVIAIKNQYNFTFRNAYKEIVNSDYVDILANKL